MKIVGIGDWLIPSKFIEEGFKPFAEKHEVAVVTWNLADIVELQNINLRVEQGGSEAYEPPIEVLDAVRDADIIITQFCTITKRLIDNCTNLKAIGVLRGGYENINIEYANEKGILVFNTPGRNANAVADFTIGMLLAECRNIARSHTELKAGRWVHDYPNSNNIPDLCGKRVGIVGYGNIGRKVAQRLKGFEVDIVAFDPYVKEADVPMVSLEELMKTSDFVTIHSRLTKETEKLINADLLASMKPTAYLINTARSGLVDEDALARVLINHKIAGAALDVFEVEPPAADYQTVCPDNVTITPHLAGSTKDAFTRSPILLAEEMMKVIFEKKRSQNIVNIDNCPDNEIVKALA